MLTQSTVPVIDRYLRDSGEQELPDRVKTKCNTRNVRKDVCPKKRHDRLGARGKIEESVGRLQEVLGILESLLVVSFEDPVISVSTEDHRKLPGEVVTVLDTRVHPLCPGGRVDMS